MTRPGWEGTRVDGQPIPQASRIDTACTRHRPLPGALIPGRKAPLNCRWSPDTSLGCHRTSPALTGRLPHVLSQKEPCMRKCCDSAAPFPRPPVKPQTQARQADTPSRKGNRRTPTAPTARGATGPQGHRTGRWRACSRRACTIRSKTALALLPPGCQLDGKCQQRGRVSPTLTGSSDNHKHPSLRHGELL